MSPLAGRTILQLGAGALLSTSLRDLRAAGANVYAVDRDPEAPGFALADGSAAVDIIDEEHVRAYAERIGADLVLAVNEAGVLAAANVSRSLGLPGLDPEVALRCLDKGLMRECWKGAGLSQPEFRTALSDAECQEAARSLGYPLVLKPRRSWGSRGVTRVFDSDDLRRALDEATPYRGKESGFILEEQIDGVEVSLEGLVERGRLKVLARSDKELVPHPRFCVDLAVNYPARLSAEQREALDDLVQGAVSALGISEGAIHCECFVTPRGPYLIELAARPGGGHIFGMIVEATSGVSFPRALAGLFLGVEVETTPRFERGACYRFFAPPPGTFLGVEGLNEARSLSGILDMGFDLIPGTRFETIANCTQRPGFVVSSGATREDAVACADRAISMLRFDVT